MGEAERGLKDRGSGLIQESGTGIRGSGFGARDSMNFGYL